MDGVLFPNGSASIGVVIHNHLGIILLAAGYPFQHWDPGGVEMAALLAIRRFVTPSMLAAKGAIIECDCKPVRDYCDRALKRSTWLENSFLSQDIAVLNEFNQVLLRLLPREVNRLTDFCAKFGAVSSFIWHDVSMSTPEFLEILQEDLDHMPSV